MENKFDLTPKQKEVIKRMRNGEEIEVAIKEGNRVNKYYLGKDRRPLQRRPIIALFDDRLLDLLPVNWCTNKFVLTELGKTIDIS